MDSTLCTVLDSVVSVLQGPVAIDGVQGTGFKGTTSNSCEETSLTKSTSSELKDSGGDNQKVFTWWVIMLIVVAILFVLFTCLTIIMIRRRKRPAQLPNCYDKVEKNDVEENEDDIPYHIKLSSSVVGSQTYPTIDVKHCPSELLGSCSTEESDDQAWNKAKRNRSRKY